jgi:hypothetical protein
MRVFTRVGLILLAFVALLPTAAHAQASIAGIVRDTSGAVLPGVTVEAASPALIERSRSVVTDGAGQYRIENLRPGSYTVTFTLPGFSTVKRDGVELTGSFTASINADMKVGAVEETITVSGEAPVVDVQSATKERVLNHEIADAIPSGRMPNTYASLIPGVSSSASSGPNADVGGSQLSGNLTSLSIHGIGGNDMRTTQNGVTWNTVGSFGSLTPAVPNMAAIQEVAVDYSSVSADMAEGGIRINFIPKDGGNTYHGTFFGGFTNDSLAGDNFTDDLKNRGLRTPDKIRKNWDVNPGFGGPIRQDKLWFYGAFRYNGAGLFTGGMFYNQNANNPNAWTYVADTNRPASNDSVWKDGQARLTWQVNQKNKIAVTYDEQVICNCLATISATQAPEAARYWYFPVERSSAVDWTSPLTNKLLLEAVMFTRYERYIMERVPGLNPLMIHVQDQLNNLNYRARDVYANNWTPNLNYRFSVSYITGSHALKVGINDGGGSVHTTNYDNQPVSFRVNSTSGTPVPNLITMRATPYETFSSVDHNTGLFVQDKWTINRLTATGGVRFDHFGSSFPSVTLGSGPLVPTRNLTIPDTANLHWNDVTPKFGASYDVFGNGKTALKGSVNEYLAGQGGTGGLGLSPSPVNLLVLTTTRTWTDANRDFIPQCDLLNTAANGECGQMANPNFGKQVAGTRFDPDILGGWGHRGYNWEFSAGVQHEVMPRVSVDFSYFRRIFGNFIITDNLAVAASDYDQFSFKAPSEPRLPGGGGYTITGLYDLNPSKFGIPANNLVTFASNYGKQYQHWNGVDLTINARPRQGVLLQGGLSTGRLVTDICDVAPKVPEALFAMGVAPSATATVTGAQSGVMGFTQGATASPTTWTPLQYCHQQTPFLSQVKLLGSYTVPKVDVQVSGTLQSVPGPIINANYTATNAVIAPFLGRNLAGNAPNTTVNLVQAGTMIGERLNQLDLRFAKLFKVGATRASAQVDVYNALNGNTVLTQNDAFAVWQQPTSILVSRFVKFSVQIDF